MSQPPHDADTPPEREVMSNPAESSGPSPAERARIERAARLASALRDNLRRRKAPRAPTEVRDRN